MSRPRIGLNCDVADDAGKETLKLAAFYVDGVVRGGGLPVVLPPVEDPDLIAQVLGAVDGLVLVGGRDYNPGWYGEERHPKTRLLEPRRMAFDRALAVRALAMGIPTLGICGGEQLICVARGGTLIQHVADAVPGALQHARDGAAERFHDIEVAEGSRLAGTLGTTSLEVNTSHHQAVASAGDGLEVVAKAPDGVVEAIEGAGDAFVLGVQWHPERLLDRPESVALFEALADAAARR